MKKHSVLSITPSLILLTAVLAAAVAASFFLNRTVFYIELAVLVLVLGFVLVRLHRMKKDMMRYIERVAGHLNHAEQNALSQFPLPAVVCSAEGAVVWYNDSFRHQVMDGEESFGAPVGVVTNGCQMRELQKKRTLDVALGGRRYMVYVSEIEMRDAGLYVLYYVDVTHYKQIETEYAASRPALVLIYIDNVEELMQNVRDSERAQVIGRVETLLEDWVSSGSGILRKYNNDWFQVVLEHRQLQTIIDGKFDILDRVRALRIGDAPGGITLSIGVGEGETLRESEQLARQAIDMALGRGGDQAAVKTKNGFDFYGGVSKGVEKRTKVRTRVVASALRELIEGSDSVLVMGHRFSDLDCLGSAVALAVTARSAGKPAFVVVSRAQTLAAELLERYDEAGRSDLFLEPGEAAGRLTGRTLLIVTDTHNPHLVESDSLLREARTVAVIDHHRKMVEHIDKAVLFYHEPYASSASELVAELVQYMEGARLSRLEAEALLAGIMLDTRGFVMKAGVRTFEAAAYLRRLGADTVEVKRMFSGSMDMYRKKSEIVSGAIPYKGTAIACGPSGGTDMRVAAAQAADELLSIKGVDASFALFSEGDAVNISARSFGAFNVQLVMEAIGGGGHLTMAGAQLRGVTMEEAKQQLMRAIDAQLEERERSLAAQLSQT